MLRQVDMRHRFEFVFSREQSEVLAQVITEAYNELVKTDDFNELKAIVKELAVAQRQTEQRLEELAVAQRQTEQRLEELAEAQKQTEQRLEELAEAQKQTEQRLEELAEAQKQTHYEIQILNKKVKEQGTTIGGIGNSLGYALENEAYRMLPALLKKRYGLEMVERFVRTYIGGKEINIFGRAKQNGKEVLIVGESKARLDERRIKRDIWEQLEKKVEAVKEAYPGTEVKRLVVTHYARPGMLKQAEKREVIIIQSFEW